MAAPRNAAAGFTLLELIVALALTSLVSLVAYSAVSLSIKAIKGSQAAADRLQELRVCQTILERSLASAVKGSLKNPLYFVGDRQEMRFFTALPLEAHSLGGIYHWRILMGQDEKGQGLLAVEQAKNVNWRRDPESVEVRQILIDNLAGAQFGYGRGADEFETWDTKKERRLPDWVRITVTQKGRPSEAWLIPIHVAEYVSTQR